MSGGDQGIYMSRLCLEWRNQVSGQVDVMDSSFWSLILHPFFTLTVTAAIPLSVHIAMLTVLMLFNGVAFGSLDNGRSTGTYEHPHRNIYMPIFWGFSAQVQ